MRSQCWLINTRSGRREGERLAQALESLVTVVPIDFTQLEQQLAFAGRFDRIIVAGGDGTFSAVLTSRFLPDRPVALVPLGTANDLARELGTFRAVRRGSWSELPEMIDQFHERPHACWDIQSGETTLSFCNYISLGFEGAVVSDFDRWRNQTTIHSRIVNRLMYVWFGLRHWFLRLRGIGVRVDRGASYFIRPTRGIIFTNIQSHMGCGISAQGVNPSDDALECVIASSPLDYARMVLSLWSPVPAPRSLCRGSFIEISDIPIGTAIQVDGEAARPLPDKHATITFRKFARVLVPKARSSKHSSG